VIFVDLHMFFFMDTCTWLYVYLCLYLENVSFAICLAPGSGQRRQSSKRLPSVNRWGPLGMSKARGFSFFSHRTHLVNLVNSVGFIGVFVSIHIHTKKFHWAKRGLKLKIMTGVLVYTSPKKRLDQNGGYIYISMEFFLLGPTHQPINRCGKIWGESYPKSHGWSSFYPVVQRVAICFFYPPFSEKSNTVIYCNIH
jgi:hypothetical protein